MMRKKKGERARESAEYSPQGKYGILKDIKYYKHTPTNIY